MNERELLIERLIDDAENAVGSWHTDKQKQFIDYAESYINDWYRADYNLTDDEITWIAEMTVDYIKE